MRLLRSADRKAMDRCSQSVFFGGEISLFRNLSGEKFSGWTRPHERTRIQERVEDAIRAADLSGAPHVLFCTRGDEHLQIFAPIRPDQLETLPEVAREVDAVDTLLESHLDFAWTPEFGYASPLHQHAGTGLVVTGLFLLSGLRATGDLDRVIEAFNRLHFKVDGLRDADGVELDIFRIENLQTLGIDEAAILSRAQRLFAALIEHEARARLRLMREESLRLLDRARRARAIAHNALLIDEREAFALAAEMRMSLTMGFTNGLKPATIDDFLMECPTQQSPESGNASAPEAPDPEEIESEYADRLALLAHRIVPRENALATIWNWRP